MSCASINETPTSERLSTKLDPLEVIDSRIITSQSGAIKTTGIRDDIRIEFYDGTREDLVGGIYDDGSVNGTATFNATEGRAVFSVPATPNSTAIFRSEKMAVYEAGHSIRGEQTIVVSELPIGDAFIEWGFGDGDNTLGYRLDSDGLKVIRRKNGVLENAVLQSDWNRDKCDGSADSAYIFNFAPQVLSPLKNNRYVIEFEWLGVSPPDYYVIAPNKTQVNIHTEEFPNQYAGTTIPDPRLPVFIHISNGTSGQALSVESGSWRGAVYSDAVSLLGQQPDMDFVSSKADGTVYSTTAVLNPSQQIVTAGFDTDGWRSIEIYIATDQVSASDGIEIQYTPDIQAAVPVWYPGPKRTFSAIEVAQGFSIYRFSTAMDGFRVKYTNGGVLQGNFLFQVNLHVTNVELPQGGFKTSVNASNASIMTRGMSVAENDVGAIDNVKRGNRGGLRFSTYEHESSMPVRPCDNWKTSKVTITNTAALALTAAASLAKRTTVELFNSDNNVSVHVAPSVASITGGQFRTIPPGGNLILELGPADIAAQSASSSVSLEITEIAETTLPNAF